MEGNQTQADNQSSQTNNQESQHQSTISQQTPQNEQRTASSNQGDHDRLLSLESKVDGLTSAVRGLTNRIGTVLKGAETDNAVTPAKKAEPDTPKMDVKGMRHYVEIRRGTRIVRRPVITEEEYEAQHPEEKKKKTVNDHWLLRPLW
jgi:hypothetical protein